MTRSCREIEPQLSLLVDGLLTGEDAAAARRHLAGCPGCRALLADLERLRDTARQLGPIAPPAHVWLEVAGQIRLDGARGSEAPAGLPRAPAMRQWIGLAAALVLITAALYMARGLTGQISPGAGSAPATAVNRNGADPVTDDVNLAVAPAEKVIADLEAMTASGSARMDAPEATVFRDGLGKIDVAIAESRTALTSNPDSESARDSLIEALRRKISVLQTMVSLINEMRLGDEQGAAKTAESLGKKS